MDILTPLIALMVALVTMIEGQNVHMEQAPPTMQPGGQHPTAPHTLHNKDQLHDRGHIQEHYDGVLKQEENLSEEEMNFHYFKVHDYDHNNMLDGIELISALTHYHKDDGPDAPRLPDLELTNMIDVILNEDDANNDGYIDYPEFIMSQRR